jgi:HSP20 family protein
MCSPCTPSARAGSRPGDGVGRAAARVFSRQLFLGENLDTDAIEASYGGGVLRLTIPVAEKAKPRRIQITSSDEKKAITA